MTAKQKGMLYRCLIVIVSNLMMGLACGTLRLIQFGIDPFSGLMLGGGYFFRGPLHMPFVSTGVFQSVFNLILIVFVLCKDRHFIGFGTIFNMFFLGFVADWGELLSRAVLGSDFTFVVRLLILSACVVVISAGVGVYTSADMGVGPYDALPYIISHMTHGKFHVRYERMLNDFLCALIAFLFALTVGKVSTVIGVATIFFAVGLGPLNYFFKVHLGDNLLLRNVER